VPVQVTTSVEMTAGSVADGSSSLLYMAVPATTGGVILSGIHLVLATLNVIGGGRALAGGDAFVSYFAGGLVGGGVILGGESETIVVKNVQGGMSIGGNAVVQTIYSFLDAAGVKLLGKADVSIGVTNRTRVTYHRFQIGETVYVPSSSSGREMYLAQVVQGILTWNGEPSYKVRVGWYPERLVLSRGEHRAWLKRVRR